MPELWLVRGGSSGRCGCAPRAGVMRARSLAPYALVALVVALVAVSACGGEADERAALRAAAPRTGGFSVIPVHGVDAWKLWVQ